jgi:DNA polymerase I
VKIIDTSTLTQESLPNLSPTVREWVYNGLDTCVTLEVFENIYPQLDNLAGAVYSFSRELQGPALEINMRGLLVDLEARDQLCREYERQIAVVEAQLIRLIREGIGWEGLSKWNSPGQIGTLLYEVMGLPEQKQKGKRTTNRDALEKIASQYYDAEPLINRVLFLRDKIKKVQVLRTRIDPDGRLRTSVNIAGTDTGRFSSSFSEFGASGGNLQNIEEGLRRIFIADPGMKFAYIDKEQAESRAVGAICWNLFRLSNYLDACESGDLHTSVCRMAWRQVPWTGDLKQDRVLADEPFYRQHSRRHMAKVLGHGTNYAGQPFTMRQHTKVDLDVIREFQQLYFEAFPELPMWHDAVKRTLWTDGFLINLLGRRRRFFGRRNEADIQRKAIAYDPQGSVADILNRDMLRVWRLNICQIMLQIHDAILIQYPEEREDEIIPQVLSAMKTEVPLEAGRSLLIPNDVQVGWNWGKQSDDNPDGLKKYKNADSRKRERFPATSLLDRRF